MPAPAFGPLLAALVRSVGASTFASGARAAAAGAARAGGQATLAQQVRAAGFEAGTAYTAEQIGRKLGTPNPSAEQVNAVRQQQGEDQRREHLDEMSNAAKRAAKALTGLASAPAVMYAVTSGIERFGSALLQRQDELRKFGSGIATAFAQLDRQQVVLQARRAANTGGTTVALADAIMELRNQLAPFRDAITNIWNSVGTLFVRLASIVVRVIESTGVLTILEWLARIAERFVGDQRSRDAKAAGLQGDLRNFFAQVKRGNFGRPISQTPGVDGIF